MNPSPKRSCLKEVRSFIGVAVGKVLNMKRSGVCLAARRGEKIVQQNPGLREKVLG